MNRASTRSNQTTRTDKQTITTKNKQQSKEKLRKEERTTPWLEATIVTTQERLRTELSLKRHDYRGSKCNREDNYTLVVFYENR